MAGEQHIYPNVEIIAGSVLACPFYVHTSERGLRSEPLVVQLLLIDRGIPRAQSTVLYTCTAEIATIRRISE